MKILVTGAKGMLGQDLCPILEQNGYEVIPTDYDTLDITNETQAKEVILNHKPDIIIHAAAYTNVDKAESDYDNAYKLNAIGSANIAKIASEINATIVYVSTDYVFDGTKETPYLPNDKTNPISVYGETKLLGEKEIQKYCKKFYIARTAWLYGIHGKNFVETMISKAKETQNPTLKVVDDQIGSPTWTVELISGILKLIKENMPYGIYHLSGKNETSWHGFAKKIFELENLKVNLIPCTTDEFPRVAKRPKYSYIGETSFLNDWQTALVGYLKTRKETK